MRGACGSVSTWRPAELPACGGRIAAGRARGFSVSPGEGRDPPKPEHVYIRLLQRPASKHRRRSDESRGRSARAGLGIDEQKLVDAALGQRFRRQVLEAEQAHLHVHGLRHQERPLRILARHRADAPRVGTERRDPPVIEPADQLEARTRLAGEEPGVVLAPQAAPAGVDEDHIARADRQPSPGRAPPRRRRS